jgi:hypothetical protein
LVVGSATNDAAVLAVGSANQVLTVDSSTTTGLKWAAASSGAYTVVKARTNFSAVTDTGTTFDNVFTSTYKNYIIIIDNISGSLTGSGSTLNMKLRYSGSTQATYNGNTNQVNNAGTVTNINGSSASAIGMGQLYSGDGSLFHCLLFGANDSGVYTKISYFGHTAALEGSLNGSWYPLTARSYDGFQLSASSGTITGNVTIYGLAVS